jgi:hypothetical protein
MKFADFEANLQIKEFYIWRIKPFKQTKEESSLFFFLFLAIFIEDIS